MSAITEAYAKLAGSLQEAGFTVKDHVPESIVPPLIVVSSADNFLAPSGAMNGAEVELSSELWLFIKPATNKETLNSLFEMLETSLLALENTDWDWTAVSPPTMYSYGTNMYLTSRVEVNTLIELGVD